LNTLTAMRRILPPADPQGLFDLAQTCAIEQAARAGLLPHTLMRRAGLATAHLALAVAPHARRVWIAAGPGNNGGDGLEAAVHLAQWGQQVEVSLMGDPALLPDDAKNAFARATSAGLSINVGRPAPLAAPGLAIDALLGIGASRAPQGSLAAAVHHLNALPCAVLAVDLPSGLHAGTGQPLGEACVEADHTLALLTLKSGLFTGRGRDHAGTVWLDTLGVDTTPHTPCAWLSGLTEVALPAPRHDLHKGNFGDVVVIGGAPGMTGAALLAARAAHAAGAGRVIVNLLGGPGVMHDPLRPELMFRPLWPGTDLDALTTSTVVCGCGGGDAVRPALPRLLSQTLRLVLDADALNAIATDTALQHLLQSRGARRLGTVLTPHPLEAARLLGTDTASVQADRLAAAQRLADRFHCTVLLKGSGTVIASIGQPPSINPTGNSALASAGTGDVLAGWLGGLWPQWGRALPGADHAAVAHTAARAAAFVHGAAADTIIAGPLRAADLIERIHLQRQSPRR
jgi:ADP-dependent NAD(P)H-hydrate dehydratase / NAD(P)H-hydrate epimerase